MKRRLTTIISVTNVTESIPGTAHANVDKEVNETCGPIGNILLPEVPDKFLSRVYCIDKAFDKFVGSPP